MDDVAHALADDTGPDPAALFTDLDGDGHVDVTAVDTDGDGVLDLAWTDTDGDGQVTDDEVHAITDGGWSTDWYRHEDNFVDGALPSDASAARDDGIHGDPEQASSYWYEQSINGYCVPASIAQVVGEWRGHNVGEQEVVDRAVRHGWLTTTDTDGDGRPDDASGMTSSEGEALLESYGIPATTTHGSLKDLESLLDQDRDIIAYVDADEIWYHRDDDASDGGSDADHAVVVTGIDDENVYLADPGDPSGAVSVVPRDTFEDAWSDSGHEMLVTDTAPPQTVPADNAPTHDVPAEGADPRSAATGGTAPTDTPTAKPLGASRELISPHSTGVVFLPVVLRDVAVATGGVSALLSAVGIVRRRTHMAPQVCATVRATRVVTVP